MVGGEPPEGPIPKILLKEYRQIVRGIYDSGAQGLPNSTKMVPRSAPELIQEAGRPKL